MFSIRRIGVLSFYRFLWAFNNFDEKGLRNVVIHTLLLVLLAEFYMMYCWGPTLTASFYVYFCILFD